MRDAASGLADDAALYLVAVAVGLGLAWLLYRPAAPWVAASAVSAALLVGLVGVAAADRRARFTCSHAGVHRFLERETPKDAIVAGNPTRLDCVGVAARRGVVMSEKLFQVWEVDYWQEGRRRMWDSVEAYYGDEMDDLLLLRDRYGADYLVVERKFHLDSWKNVEPFTSRVRELVDTVEEPNVRRLPPDCIVFKGGRDLVYDLACVADRARSPGAV